MSVSNFCTHNVVTVSQSDTVQTAAERMAQENVGTLVVVDDGNKPVGIATDRDLVIRVLAKRLPAQTIGIYTVMTPKPVCITEETSLESAIRQMRFHKIRRLVVVNAAQEVAGILALDDIVETLTEEQEILKTMTDVMGSVRHEKL